MLVSVQKKITRQGFTLIEVMVAIAIVAVLSTIGLVIYAQAQKQARISKRINDLKAIRTALEVYKSANNGGLPTTFVSGGTVTFKTPCHSGVTPGVSTSTITADTASYITNTNNFVPNFMTVLPNDPSMIGSPASTNATGGCYAYASEGNDYKVLDMGQSATEMTTGPSGDFATHPELLDPARITGSTTCLPSGATAYNAWAIYTPTACLW